MKVSPARPRQIFVPYNDKIADITHADTNKHTLDLESALVLGLGYETRKIIAVWVRGVRVGGTGNFDLFPNEGSTNFGITNYTNALVVIKDGTQRLQYALSVANDDWDLICGGYVVET